MLFNRLGIATALACLCCASVALGQGAARPKSRILTVDDVEALTQMHTTDNPQPVDGQVVETRGWHDPGDVGGATYRYVFASAAVVNGVTVLDGLGGDNTIATLGAATTTPGTGVGRFVMIDQTSYTSAQAGCHETAVTNAQNKVRFQAAVDSGDTLYVSPFVHTLSEIQLDDDQSVIGVSPTKSVLKLGYDGAPAPAGVFGMSGQSLLKTEIAGMTSNISISRLTLEGSRDEVDFSGVAGDGAGNAVYLWGVDGCQLSDLIINNCWTDGMFITSTHETGGARQNSENFTVSDIRMNNIGRNGVTIIAGAYMTFDNLVIKKVDRTIPKAAIDLEPNGNETFPTHDIHFNNVSAEQVLVLLTSWADSAAGPQKRVTISNSSVLGDATIGMHSAIRAQNGSHIVASNIQVTDWTLGNSSPVFDSIGHDAATYLQVNNSYVNNCIQFVRATGANATTVMQSCRVDEVGGFPGLATDGANLEIRDTHFRNLNTANTGSLFTVGTTGAPQPDTYTLDLFDCTFTNCEEQGLRLPGAGTSRIRGCVFDGVDRLPVNVLDSASLYLDDCEFINANQGDASFRLFNSTTSGIVSMNDIVVRGAQSLTTNELFDLTTGTANSWRTNNVRLHPEVTYARPLRQTGPDAGKLEGHGNSWQDSLTTVYAVNDLQCHAGGFYRCDGTVNSILIDEHANWNGCVITIQNNSSNIVTVGVVAAPVTITGTATIQVGDTAVFRSDGTTFHRLEGI